MATYEGAVLDRGRRHRNSRRRKLEDLPCRHVHIARVAQLRRLVHRRHGEPSLLEDRQSFAPALALVAEEIDARGNGRTIVRPVKVVVRVGVDGLQTLSEVSGGSGEINVPRWSRG